MPKNMTSLDHHQLFWSMVVVRFGQWLRSERDRHDLPIEGRAQELERFVPAPTGRMARNMARARVMLDWDLLQSEAAMHPSGLQLLSRLFQDPFWREDLHLSKSPVFKLWGAVIGQAVADGANRVVVDFGASERFAFHFGFEDGSLPEAIICPANLATPTMGAARLAEAVGRSVFMPNVLPDKPEITQGYEWVYRWGAGRKLEVDLHVSRGTVNPQPSDAH